MSNTGRIIAKAITWQASGLIMMTLLGYLYTGSLQSGGSLALTSMVIGFVCYVLHEQAWNLTTRSNR